MCLWSRCCLVLSCLVTTRHDLLMVLLGHLRYRVLFRADLRLLQTTSSSQRSLSEYAVMCGDDSGAHLKDLAKVESAAHLLCSLRVDCDASGSATCQDFVKWPGRD